MIEKVFVPIRWDPSLPRLAFESYFIHRKFVRLSYNDLQQLPATYAGKLFIWLQEMDKIQAEKQKKASKVG